MRAFGLFVSVLLCMLFFPSFSESQESCVNAECHATILSGSTVHAATESCESCHESVSTPHPLKGQKTFKLIADGSELCGSCHDPMDQKAHVHTPVKEGECTSCHNPHSANEPKLLVEPVENLCGTCHSDQTEFKNVHGPVSAGQCLTCHTPHESDNASLLLKKQDELCFECHSGMQNIKKMKSVHAALEDGCTACHNPHGSANEKLLIVQKKELCASCHGDIGQQGNVHAPLKSEESCTSCHLPHASDNPPLLVKAGKALCLSCHNTVITSKMTLLHAPIKDGSCTDCHKPHESPNEKLLAERFSTSQYVAYSDTEYELCFSCHDRELVQYPDTSFATSFRDGERNLHYLHVNKQKGRNCTMCHNVHGGSLPALIADSVPFGKWKLPLKFVKTETGGSCSPGCHKPQTYDRNKP